MKKSRAKQDELTRRRRLMRGLCPVHGCCLPQTGVWQDENGQMGPTVGCPRDDCKFEIEVRPGTRLWQVLVENQ